AEQYKIDHTDAGDVVGCLGGPDMGRAAVALYPQPVLADRREMRAARDKGDIRSGCRERGAVGPTDAARADHRDAHPVLLFSVGPTSLKHFRGAANYPSAARPSRSEVRCSCEVPRLVSSGRK